MVRTTGDREVTLTTTETFAPSFVLNAPAARPGALVDEKTVMEHEEDGDLGRSEEHTSELQSLMRISYACTCLKNENIVCRLLLEKKNTQPTTTPNSIN